jgi:hypothetical protein
MIGPAALLLRARSRAVWADPARKLRTLEGFSRTEGDGARDIEAALRHVTDPQLRALMERHAADEARHAELFRVRAAQLRALGGGGAGLAADPEKLYDLSFHRDPERGEVDAHGFFTAGVFEERGEIAYVAMLHVAERRAAAIFRVHRDVLRDDPETSAIFDEILRDEQFHVAYTGKQLQRWRKAGRGREVRSALSEARGSRFVGAWKRAGARAGASFGRGLLTVLYSTVLAPFALLTRWRHERAGWHEPQGGGGSPADRSRSQH